MVFMKLESFDIMLLQERRMDIFSLTILVLFVSVHGEFVG